MESKVVGSLRRRIRQYKSGEEGGCGIVWNRYSVCSESWEEGGGGQGVELLKFRLQRWSGSGM